MLLPIRQYIKNPLYARGFSTCKMYFTMYSAITVNIFWDMIVQLIKPIQKSLNDLNSAQHSFLWTSRWSKLWKLLRNNLRILKQLKFAKTSVTWWRNFLLNGDVCGSYMISYETVRRYGMNIPIIAEPVKDAAKYDWPVTVTGNVNISKVMTIIKCDGKYISNDI